jgi:hypothetical protein
LDSNFYLLFELIVNPSKPITKICKNTIKYYKKAYTHLSIGRKIKIGFCQVEIILPRKLILEDFRGFLFIKERW